jgi:hypothetical protein
MLYMYPKWRWEAIKGGNQPEPLHHGLISTRLSPRIAKIWPSFSCVVTVQGCTHMPTYLIERCQNTLYMSNMDMGSNLQWSTASTITSWLHFHLTVAKNCQNLTQLRKCNGARVHSYTYVPHWKVKKHFIYVHYGCGKQSKVDYSLNHDIMASFPLDSHPELLQTNHSGFIGVTV